MSSQILTPKKRKRSAALLTDWYMPFLDALRERPNVRNAVRAVGISRVTAYKHRKENPALAAAWDEALEEGIEALEDEAMRRAFEGYDKPVTYQGEITDTYKEFSDVLAIFLLKAHKPEKYRDRYEIKVASWQDELVDSIKDGSVEPEDLRKAFPDIAEQLLLRAGK